MRRRFINIQDNDYGVIRINSDIITDSFINGTIFPQNIFKKAIIEFGESGVIIIKYKKMQ